MNKDNLYVLLLITFFLAQICHAQSIDYSKCAGGISLSPNNFYSLAFQGKKGVDKKSLYGYETSRKVYKNQIWLFFDTPSSGMLNLNIKRYAEKCHIYMFEEKGGQICQEIEEQRAKFIFSESNSVGLDAEFIFVQEALRYAVVLIAEEGIKDSLDFSFDFSGVFLNLFWI